MGTDDTDVAEGGGLEIIETGDGVQRVATNPPPLIWLQMHSRLERAKWTLCKVVERSGPGRSSRRDELLRRVMSHYVRLGTPRERSPEYLDELGRSVARLTDEIDDEVQLVPRRARA
jgi:hypothetical protein